MDPSGPWLSNSASTWPCRFFPGSWRWSFVEGLCTGGSQSLPCVYYLCWPGASARSIGGFSLPGLCHWLSGSLILSPKHSLHTSLQLRKENILRSSLLVCLSLCSTSTARTLPHANMPHTKETFSIHCSSLWAWQAWLL